jgi:hypothetical protein
MGDNFRQAFPTIDTGNLPPEFARFKRITAPEIGPFDVLEGPVYEWDGSLVKDVWTILPMTEEAKAAKISEYQAMPPPFPNWTLNLDTLVWEAPVPKPTEGGPYRWDINTNSWVVFTQFS